MSIASAIAATNPSIWLKLDEASGTAAANSGSSSNAGTFSGSYEQGLPGPEIGTFATRLFSGGQIVTGGMDLTTFVGQSLGLWLSTNAAGSTSTNYPIVNIGDPGNRLLRGPQIVENHTAIGSPNVLGRFGGVGTGLQPLPATVINWHWVVVTYASGTNGIKLYVDGNLAQQGNLTSPGALVATDPLLVRCDEPCVVAHVCWWGATLTQTEIQSVSNERSTWPHGDPINADTGGGGGGGGLTEDQAEQLGRIEGYTDDIPGLVDASVFISDTVNTIAGQQLADHNLLLEIQDDVRLIKNAVEIISSEALPALQAKVDEVWDSVRRQFITMEGVALSSAIGGLLAHPDRNFLKEFATSFTISGRGHMPSPGVLGFSNVYGVRWLATTIPPQYGVRDGTIPEYLGRLVQFTVYYPDRETLIPYDEQVADFRYEAFTFYWNTYNPAAIDYDVTPGFTLTCKWIGYVP